jgi:hypothetical protein
MTDLLQVLADMQQGQVLCDCNEKFNELLKAVEDTGGKGELTIKVFVKPAKFALGGGVLQMELEHEAKTKLPELAVGSSLFFVKADGDITRNHPDQEVLEYDTDREEREKKNG